METATKYNTFWLTTMHLKQCKILFHETNQRKALQEGKGENIEVAEGFTQDQYDRDIK